MVATVAAGTSADYYIASSDYYIGGIEPAGRWVAVGVDVGVALGAVVKRAPFERLHAALDADGRFMLAGQGGKKHVGGYDVTFSAPKSCSIVWALADDALRAEIELAHAHAVAAALTSLEANAAFCRSGKDGIRREKVRLTIAVFQHGDARPAMHSDGSIFADCALHEHAVIANIARKYDRGTVGRDTCDASEARYGALDGKAIFAWKMAVGAVYHAAFSKFLQELGFAVGDVGKNGIFEVVGIEAELKSYFSARRGEVEDELELIGVESSSAPALAAAITKSTRRSKQSHPDQDRFAFWQQRAGDLGFNKDAVIETCLAAGREQRNVLSSSNREHVIQARLTALPDQLTEHDSTFERRHLYAAIAAAFVGTGESVERVEAEVETFIAQNLIVTLDHDVWGHEVFTTPELLRIESEIGAIAIRLSGRLPGAPSASIVEHTILAHGLNREQADAVRAATSGAGITIVEGAPGSGKTTALSAITQCWTTAGFRVIGAAAAWKVAHALRDELDIDARATDAWRVGADHGVPFLDRKTVLIVDEAGLLSSRQMHGLLAAVEAAGESGVDQPRILLVGSRNQMQSVGAGPGLALAAAGASVQSVTTIVRQHEPWARDAVIAFGKGDATGALEAFHVRGLLHETVGPKATVQAMVDASETHEETARGRSLLIAKTNTQVRALSMEVRARLRRRSIIRGDDITLRAVTSSNATVPLSLAVGDRVRFLTRLTIGGVETINGTEGTVEAIQSNGDDHCELRVRTEAGRFTFTTDEIADDKGRVKLAHAYATTIYGSQGCTTDRAFVWLTPEMDRHATLVAASRARNTTDLFCDIKSLRARILAERPLSERSEATEIGQDERRAYLAAQLSRSGFKRSSLDIIADAQQKDIDRGSLQRRPTQRATREMSLE